MPSWLGFLLIVSKISNATSWIHEINSNYTRSSKDIHEESPERLLNFQFPPSAQRVKLFIDVQALQISFFSSITLYNYQKSHLFFLFISVTLKGTLSGLRLLLATESPLIIMKNDFYSTLKHLFVVKIFKFLSWLFGHIEKWLD